MTAQIPDRVLYAGKEFALIGCKGEDLPTPHTFGLLPAMWSTACYRGYVATYACVDDELYLAHQK